MKPPGISAAVGDNIRVLQANQQLDILRTACNIRCCSLAAEKIDESVIIINKSETYSDIKTDNNINELGHYFG